MRDFFKKMIHNKVIMAIFSIIFGIVLIAGRRNAVAGIIRLLGILLLVGGVIYLLAYFFGKENKGNGSTLASGILFLLVGLIFAFTPQWLVTLFPVVMGIILIVNSIFAISGLLSTPIRTGLFTISLLLSIVSLVLGIVAVAHPGAIADVLTTLIGITYLVNGINDFMVVGVLKKAEGK